MQKLAKFIYHSLLGWKIVGTFPAVDKCVVIVVPHTSWLDFPLGLLARKVLNEEMHYAAKKSLFRPLYGWYFRWTGGVPIDRTKRNDTVSALVQLFNERAKFRLTVAPEGTRKKVGEWKTGFYYIARAAAVPIVMVALDYGKKQIKVSPPIYTTADREGDLAIYKAFFRGVVGKVTKNS
jgi:1-acyl-sn-glycerol-3-phosphate acyltransferase